MILVNFLEKVTTNSSVDFPCFYFNIEIKEATIDFFYRFEIT